MDKKYYDFMLEETTDDVLKEAMKIIEENEDEYGSDYSISGTVSAEMFSDDEDDSNRLLEMYLDADKKERAIMDAMLVCLCGYSMSSIIDIMLEN